MFEDTARTIWNIIENRRNASPIAKIGVFAQVFLFILTISSLIYQYWEPASLYIALIVLFEGYYRIMS